VIRAGRLECVSLRTRDAAHGDWYAMDAPTGTFEVSDWDFVGGRSYGWCEDL